MANESESKTLPVKSFKEELREFRDAFSDEIPAEILNSISPNNRFKVRKGWFQGLVARLECGIMFGDITNPLIVSKTERGMARFTSSRFQKNLTTKRDITYANLLIDLVLKEG